MSVSSSADARARARRRYAATAAVAVYLVLALLPLIVALSPPQPAGRSVLIELSLAAGFVGLGQLGLQLALIARFRRVSQPFGIDLVMQYHRYLGILATLMIVAHPLLLWWQRSGSWRALVAGSSTAATVTGVVSMAALLLLIALSYGRRPFGLSYETWRVTHALLGIAALMLGWTHTALAGTYVATSWKRLALGLWCAVFVGLIAYLRLIMPFALARRPWQVTDVRPDAAETWRVRLAPLGHWDLTFAPGQFAWFKVGVSPWSLREHPMSFASSAEHPESIELGIKETGDFTRTIGTIERGTEVYIDGPHGSFSCDFHHTPGFLFVAGGIGVTPILSMLRTLADRADGHPHSLVYACSRWERVAFRDEIAALRERLNLDVHYVLERAPPAWTGATGYVDRATLALILGSSPSRRQVLVCGPNPMMDAVEAALRACGVPPHRISMERFNLV